MTQYNWIISYMPGESQLRCHTNVPQGNGAYRLNGDDTLKFLFDGPIGYEVSQAYLIVHSGISGERSSPFVRSSPIDLLQNPIVSVDVSRGAWCFSVIFVAGPKDKKGQTYTLPDPELQVGSIGGDGDGDGDGDS